MLYIVLILVLAALGLLVASLVLTVTFLAWASLGVSVLAALGLVLDWLVRRRRAAAAPDRAEDGEDEAETRDEATAQDQAADAEATAAVAATGQPTEAPPRIPGPDEEPDEEDTDAADVLVVSESEAEVRVIDEHPRYHLARCRWLDRRPTLPLPVREARELGFGPCGVCRPDTEIAAKSHGRAAREG